MTEDEEMYRMMNVEDPWYMGPLSDESNRKESRDYKRTSEKKKTGATTPAKSDSEKAW